VALPLRAALIDVGGTLWPDGWIPPGEAEESARLDILRTELQLSNEAAVQLVDDLRRRSAEAVPAEALAAGLIQRTDDVTNAALEAAGLDSRPGAAEVVRVAMGGYVVSGERLFDGAADLLRTARDCGLRSIIVSNTFWRNAAGYVQDFGDLALGDLIDGAITSLDTGYRKPHASMFDGALRLAGCDARECVFIGNVEELDIEPAAERGMSTILVCIEDPVPERSRADAVVTSLAEAASTLRAWTAAEDTSVP
jgi:FMN phosphatase YigB (HAD superfamily)